MSAIVVKNLWKKFRLYNDKRMTLKERVLYGNKGNWDEFWVLKGIDLAIHRGSTVGLIGRNGSGKSTLLKLMTRIIHPDQGSVSVNGKVSSLLELGAGFHPDFTGRENIYMNASIFGLSKREIDKRIGRIIAFAELEEFIDNPVRTYSSGMYMRLGFATAINVEPDILLVDEVLAVGDTSFQKKCLEKIRSMKAEGVTIVFVSHDMGTVANLCDQVVWLDKGEIVATGAPRKIIDQYIIKTAQNDELRMELENRSESNAEKVEVIETAEQEAKVDSTEEKGDEGDRWGQREVEITQVRLTDIGGEDKLMFESGEPVIISLYYHKHRDIGSDIVFGIGIFNSDGIQCYGTNTDIDRVNFECIPDEGCVQIHIDALQLIEGSYYLDTAIHKKDGYPFDYLTKCKKFGVFSIIKDVGVARLSHEWGINAIEEGVSSGGFKS